MWIGGGICSVYILLAARPLTVFFVHRPFLHFIYVIHKTTEQILFDVYSALVRIIYLMFSSPGGNILHCVHAVTSRKSVVNLAAKSLSFIVVQYTIILRSSQLGYTAGRQVVTNGADDDVNIHISRLTSIFPSHQPQMTHRSLFYHTI